MLTLFGPIQNPFLQFNSSYGDLTANNGLTFFISNIVKLLIIAGGLYAFINLLLAGFQYISSGSDAKAVSAAWQKIYMSLLGLVILVSAISITVIISKIFLGSYDAILSPTFYGPGTIKP